MLTTVNFTGIKICWHQHKKKLVQHLVNQIIQHTFVPTKQIQLSSNKVILTKEQFQLIEELAHVHMLMGLQPAWSKILALLTVSDETELSFEQIMETLDISKSGVSQALKELELSKRIAYKTRIGDRKRYFHLRITDWEAQAREMFSLLGRLTEVHKKILAKRSTKTKDFNKAFAAMTHFMESIYNKACCEPPK